MTNVDNDMDIFTQALSSVMGRNCDRDIANGIVMLYGFALARAEAAEATREQLADRLVFEMEQREALAARVAELEAALTVQRKTP